MSIQTSAPHRPARALIVTADDFGLSLAVNEAIEIAHRDGILTAASLMVSGNHAADAIARAKRLPGLRVGLHLALVEARPVLPASRVPALVAGSGQFRTNMALAGARMFFDRSAQAQLRAEIEAQFKAFSATGFSFDHVNAHKHFHMHPTISGLIFDVAQNFGSPPIRVPNEDRHFVNAIEPRSAGNGHRAFSYGAGLLRYRARSKGYRMPDRVIGLAWSGGMDRARIFKAIQHLPPGTTEIYTHPATDDQFDGAAIGYRYKDELAALIAPEIVDLVRLSGISTGGYSDFCRF
jgi:chitin disaccharide deacetylase